MMTAKRTDGQTGKRTNTQTGSKLIRQADWPDAKLMLHDTIKHSEYVGLETKGKE